MRYFAVFLLASILNLSCNSDTYKEHPNKLDSFPSATFRIMLPNKTLSGYYVDTVIYQIVSKVLFKDSADSAHLRNGWYHTDTFRFGRIVVDTVRDSLKHARFDSLKHPYMSAVWYPILKGYEYHGSIPNVLPDSLLPKKPKPDPNAPVKSIPKPKADTTKH